MGSVFIHSFLINSGVLLTIVDIAVALMNQTTITETFMKNNSRCKSPMIRFIVSPSFFYKTLKKHFKIQGNMEEFSYELKIPKERVAVLIGVDGDIKKMIEKETSTRLQIDSKEGDVFLYGTDALGLFTAREIIMAIGRGFNPEFARLLLKPDYVLEIINFIDYTGKSKSTMMRLKGRVIGKDGKARRLIEELSECYIAVYGKTVSIIGLGEHVPFAKRAVESLLDGSSHANVYKWLEKKRRDLKRSNISEGI